MNDADKTKAQLIQELAEMHQRVDELTTREIQHAQTEKTLKEALQVSAGILQTIPSGLFIYQYEPPDQLHLLDGNPEAERLTGIIVEEWLGKEFNEIWPQGRATGVTEAYLEVMRTGKTFETEDLYYADERLEGAFRIRAFRIPGERLGVAFENITQRKRAEDELRRSESKMRSIFRAAPIGIGVVSNRVIVDVNDRFCEVTGYSRDALIGSEARMVYPSDEDYEYVGKEKYRQIQKRGTGTVETRFKREDGTIRDILLSSTPLDPADLSAGVTFTALDITERKRVEAALRQSAETKTVLLREVNHRVKNNLTAIIGLLYIARSRVEEISPADYPTALDDLINRVQGLTTVHSLLSDAEWAPLQFSELINQIIRATWQTLPPEKHALLKVTPSPVRVQPDQAHHLALVINELATNTIKYAWRGRNMLKIAVRIDVENNTVQFEFRDDGEGYPEEVLQLERINIGLSLVHNIVHRNLGGDLSLYNDHGAVAAVRFKLET
jgi:PAS domain S-box-containing protein